MSYLAGVGIPLLLQLGFTFIMTQAGSGGSFVGLFAMLFAVVGIPLTAIANAIVVRSRFQPGSGGYLLRTFCFALVLPAFQLGMLVLASVLSF